MISSMRIFHLSSNWPFLSGSERDQKSVNRSFLWRGSLGGESAHTVDSNSLDDHRSSRRSQVGNLSVEDFRDVSGEEVVEEGFDDGGLLVGLADDDSLVELVEGWFEKEEDGSSLEIEMRS